MSASKEVTARAVRLHAFGGPEVLRVDEVVVAAPAAGEVRIRVGAFGLNRVETLYRAGHFGEVSFPGRIGYEAAGVVDAVGPGVDSVGVGDRVATLFGAPMQTYGTNAEAILYPADMLVRIPDGQPLVEAAASWMQYGTAFALIECARIGEGDSVAITAASSSVGIAAIQIARETGALPVAITRTRAKAAQLQALGAVAVIVSDEEVVAERLRQLTGGEGARVVFDAVGGAGLSGLLEAMAPGGHAIVYGMLGGTDAALSLPGLMLGNLTLRGFSADALVRDPASRSRLVEYVGGRLASGRLRPVIDRCFAIDNIVEAHRYLESNVQLGKIVVTTAWSGE